MTVEAPELTKYNKRIEDLIEDAEIEAELEAENYVRSKNARLVMISSIGIGFLMMIYLGVNFKVDKPAKTSFIEPIAAQEPLHYVPKPKPIPFPIDQKNNLVLSQRSAMATKTKLVGAISPEHCFAIGAMLCVATGTTVL